MRLREYSDSIPKPMVPIGHRPIAWNLMKFYSHFGHKDFIMCLGHNAHVIKDYFLKYDECLTNDFVLEGGKAQLVKTDIHDWRITFADTGLKSNIGMRLKAVEKYLDDLDPDDLFMANYADGLSDVPLNQMLEYFQGTDKVACFLCVKPQQTFHYVRLNDDGTVHSIQDTTNTGLTVNGGYFIFKKRIFDYVRDGEELVHEPFERLIAENQLVAYQYDGFWKCMDTFKDKQAFDELYASGDCPWAVWRSKE
ncbi:glucose-1-phosphate cytidylyltransferase [Saccharospirillum salsuginis]|uniref:Glucose-1-phosphate cytidylyltransferase n=2 Tax=Saccharospirillum salsuginis TaxID=418750 RepID=A0A918K5U7_9GAMM|nr:glucose-1-phosphate cytidylyltransferase [Saccharospirillum salsuginis]